MEAAARSCSNLDKFVYEHDDFVSSGALPYVKGL